MRIAAWVHLEDAAVGAVEPGDHDDLVADCQAAHRRVEVGAQDDPRLWGAFVALGRRGGHVGER
jgi:hypothetical protein